VAVSVPPKKILHCANIYFSAYVPAQPCRHATSKDFQALKGLLYIYIYIHDIKCGVLKVRKNEIALRKCCLAPLHSVAIQFDRFIKCMRSGRLRRTWCRF